MGAVVRFNPFTQIDSAFDAAFDDLFRRAFPDEGGVAWTPAADVNRVGEDLEIVLELPGVDPQELDVEVNGRVLKVHGHRVVKAADEAVPLRRELRHGAFTRTFQIPPHVSADDMSASYEAGLLRIRITGARPEPKPRKVPVAAVIPATVAVESTAETDAERSGEPDNGKDLAV